LLFFLLFSSFFGSDFSCSFCASCQFYIFFLSSCAFFTTAS
jgi:hypothetical protein